MLCLVAFCLAACLGVVAQSTTEGAIAGTVYDPQGAVLPNATVIVHNNGTNAEQTVATDSSGYFRVTKLQPAVYTVTVTAAGFSPYKATNVTVNVGNITEILPRLNISGTTEVVDVTAEAPQINTTSADFAPTVNQTAIANLPINGNRWSNFVLLTPGTTHDASGFGLISFKGMSTLLNNNTVDGADNNQAFFSEERGRTRAGYSTAKVAVQEFQVNSSNYSSEYGRAAGAVVNTVTKSGTNSLHGEMYFFDRDNSWGATNPYTTIARQTSPGVFALQPYKPKDVRKIAGFGIGGPIKKDKLFFFLAYDWFNRNFPGTSIASSPTNFLAAPAAGTTTTACSGSSGPASTNVIGILACRLYGSNTAATNAQAAALWTSSLNDFVNSEMGTVPRTGEQFIIFPKVDWQVNDKNHVSVSFNRMRWASPSGIQTQASNTLGIRSFGDDFVKTTWGIAKLDTYVSANIANQLRYQVGRDFEFQNPQQPTAYETNNLLKNANTSPGYTNPFGVAPDVGNFGNGLNIGTATFLNRPKFPDELRHQIADTVTWARGRHVFKFGGDYIHTNDVSENLRFQYGSFSYSSLLNYFSDLYKPKTCLSGTTAVPCYSSFTQAFGPLGYQLNTGDIAFFAQDDWKVLPRLSLSLGARYDYEQMPEPFLANPAVPQTGRMPNDKNNFAPRVGFAYDVFGTGKTSIRGGYGVFFARIINSAIYNTLVNTGVAGGQANFRFNASTVGAPIFPQLLPSAPTGATTAKPSIVFFGDNFQNPQIYQWDLILEQDLGWNTALQISYLGSSGRQLADFADTNIGPSTSTRTYTVVDATGKGPLPAGSTYTTPFFTTRPNANFDAMTAVFSGTSSNYNALAVQLNHRMAKHIQFNTHFTWAHALDYGQNSATFTNTNSLLVPFNVKAEYGNSDTNVPLRFVFHAIAESPWKVSGPLGWLANDWQIAPLFSWQNGVPYSARTSGTLSGSGAIGGGVNGSNGDFRIDVLGRNQYRRPNTQVMDLKLSKSLRFYERYRVEFSGEAFNLFNHQNVTNTNTTAYFVGGTNTAPTLSYNAPFRSVTNANSNFAYSSRQVQLGIKVKF